jgi:hypothetical protein
MLIFFTLVGCLAMLAALSLAIMALIKLQGFNQYVAQKYPAIGKLTVFQTDKFPTPDDELLSKAQKVKNIFTLTISAFALMLVSGLVLSFIGV